MATVTSDRRSNAPHAVAASAAGHAHAAVVDGVRAESPWRRLSDYLAERFAPRLIFVFLVTYAMAMFYGQAIVRGDGLHVSLGDLAGASAFVAYLLLARVFDEHKDFAFDRVYLPDRPLPSGAISWRAVDSLGFVAVAVQVVVCLALDSGFGAVCFWWAIALAYLTLTRFWFFIPHFLKHHFVTNTLLHLPIYALGTVAAAQLGANPTWLGATVLWLALFMYVHTFGQDLWRKSHAPEDERTGVDSYTRRWGTTGASIATGVTVILSGSLAGAMLAGAHVGTPAAYVVMAIVTLPLLGSLTRFSATPNHNTNMGKRNLLMLTLLAQELVAILTLLLQRGLA